MVQTSVDFADSKPGGVYLGPPVARKKKSSPRKKVTPIKESASEQSHVANSREVSITQGHERAYVPD